ncbi:class I SAM-dependent methyltransferase [Gemella sp. zg-570]|uniref:tRNA (mnm(5)s(2)U34)-methyltransferase n=1 Tax=Gemella sp. zg-1178 TaxID=2840372 RepID=UPI00209B3185|nr:class I SAM-dependent methyltransferase [Gemella sp. zg-570]
MKNTRNLLLENKLSHKASLIRDSHEKFDKYIDEKIRGVIFNLGYLPRASHVITTQGEITKKTLEKMLTRLEIGGLIVVIVYWGHAEGKVEKEIILDFAFSLDQKYFEVLNYHFINQKNNSPFLLAIEKLKEVE